MSITSQAQLAAGLYIVATPLGNARDISLRALDVLGAADMVYCEDTRVSAKLFAYHGLGTPRQSYHEHNAAAMRPKILARLQKQAAVALISDAGTPTISDPGLDLVRAARAAGHKIYVVPGASAAIAALSIAGLPTDRFMFLGFAPRTAGARRKWLTQQAEQQTHTRATLVIYESAKRLVATLADIANTFAVHEVCVARELTKKFEDTQSGRARELVAHFTAKPPKGEVVVLIAPADKQTHKIMTTAQLSDATIKAALAEASLRDAVRALVAATGLPRKAVYQRALKISATHDKDTR